MNKNISINKLEKFLLSIVTINYNNEKNLPKTLSSLEQFRNNSCVELIFVDGKSTDGSVSIATKFYSSENLISESDSGIYNAMNKGLNKARGRYILWLNSGDALKHNVAFNVLTKLKNSKADLVSFGLEMRNDDETNPYLTWIPNIHDLPSHTLPHPTTFFLRSTTISHLGYNESFKIAADRDLIVRMYLSGCIVQVVEEVIGNYYLGGVSGDGLAIIESLRIDRELKLIDNIEFFKKHIKYQIKAFLKKI